MSESLEDRVERLERRVAALEDMVERSSGDHPPSGHGSADGRDQAVLERLQPGTRITVNQLKQLYRTHTDISNSRTLSDRVRSLTSREEFTLIKPGVWEVTTDD